MKPKVDTEYEEITEYQEYSQKEKLKSNGPGLKQLLVQRKEYSRLQRIS